MATPSDDEFNFGARDRHRPLESALLLLAAAFAYSLSFKFPFYPVFSESDHLIFVYEGWRMFGGEWIYRDFFEFTLPGSQAFYALMFHLFGPQYWIASAAVVLISAASVWVLLRVSREVIPSPLYLLPAVLFIFFGFRWFGLDPSHRMFSPIFMMAAVLTLLRGTSPMRLVSCGLFCALTSFFTQQRGIVLVAGMCLFLLIESRATGKAFAPALKKVAILAGSFAISLFAMCLPFMAAAGLNEFVEATIVYPALYYKYGAPNHFGVYFADLEKALSNTSLTGLFALLPTLFYTVILPIAVVASAIRLLLRRKNIDWPRDRAPALIGIVSLLCLLSTTAPNQYRLFQISMPMLVFVVWALNELISSEIIRRRLLVGISAFAILISLLQAVRFQTNWDFILWNTPTGTLAVVPTEQAERYFWLSEKLRPGDTFFEVYEPFLYFPLQLKNPTRFGQIWPSEYSRPEHVAEVIADLKNDPPRYILWDNSYDLPDEQRPAGDNTKPLSEFVNANYHPVGKVYMISTQPIQIWERKISNNY